MTGQLIARHWIIEDASGKVEEVRGLGVVGHQPLLKPGEGSSTQAGRASEPPPARCAAPTSCMTDERAPVRKRRSAASRSSRRRRCGDGCRCAGSRGRAQRLDLLALLTAGRCGGQLAERNLWLVRVVEWLRRQQRPAASRRGSAKPVVRPPSAQSDRHPEHRGRVRALLAELCRARRGGALFADFGFTPRVDLFGELAQRLRTRVLPATPETTDLADLFGLLCRRRRRDLAARASTTRPRSPGGAAPGEAWALRGEAASWRAFWDAIVSVQAVLRVGLLRPDAPAHEPDARRRAVFASWLIAADAVHDRAGVRPALRPRGACAAALLDACRRAAGAMSDHLGNTASRWISCSRSASCASCRPHRGAAGLRRVADPPARCCSCWPRSSTSPPSGAACALLSRHYALLAAKVAERSAEPGALHHARPRRVPGHAARGDRRRRGACR